MRIPAILISLSCLAALPLHADPLLDRVTVTTAFTMPNNTGTLDLAYGSVTCPDESILLTGGAYVLADNNGIPAYVALIASNPSGNGWTANAREVTDNPGATMRVNLMVTAVCGVTHNSASSHISMVTANFPMTRSVAGTLETVQGTANCPAGSILVSGGAEIHGSNGLVPLSVALMTTMAVGNGWYGLAREMADVAYSSATLTVRALCADAGAGISAPVVATADGVFADDGNLNLGSATATCPAGKSRLSGGAQILASNNGIPPSVALVTSEPNGSTGWYSVAREMTNIARAPLTLHVTSSVNCATLTGISGIQVVSRTSTLPNTVGILDGVAGAVQCPVGKSLIGGGARILASNNGIPGTVALVSSLPTGNGWTGYLKEMSDADHSLAVNLTVEAVCAILPQ